MLHATLGTSLPNGAFWIGGPGATDAQRHNAFSRSKLIVRLVKDSVWAILTSNWNQTVVDSPSSTLARDPERVD
jgi:hypothetical protein